jgi:hypothetical protein
MTQTFKQIQVSSSGKKTFGLSSTKLMERDGRDVQPHSSGQISFISSGLSEPISSLLGNKGAHITNGNSVVAVKALPKKPRRARQKKAAKVQVVETVALPTTHKGPRLGRRVHRLPAPTKPKLSGGIDRQMSHNSMCYVQSVMHPDRVKGCRVPDATPIPSAVGTGSSTITLTAVQIGATTTWVGGIYVRPTVNATCPWATITAAAALDNYTWTAGSQPAWISNIAANATVARPVSISVAMQNNAALLNVAGRAFYATTVSLLGSTPTLGATVTATLKTQENKQELNLATCKNCRFSWMPLGAGPSNLMLGGNFRPNASTWTDTIGSVNMVDNTMFVWFEFTGTSTASNSNVDIDIVFNYEFVPLPGSENLFSMKTVPSSVDEANAMLSTIASRGPTSSITIGEDDSKMGQETKSKPKGKGKSRSGRIIGKIGEGIGGPWGGLISGLSEQIGSVVDSAASWFAGLFSAEDVRRHRAAIVMCNLSASPIVNGGYTSDRNMDAVAFNIALMDTRFKNIDAMRLPPARLNPGVWRSIMSELVDVKAETDDVKDYIATLQSRGSLPAYKDEDTIQFGDNTPGRRD